MDNVTIMPLTFNSGYQHFVIRTRPGEQDAVFKATAKTLYGVNRMRVLSEKTGVRTFDMVRSSAYEADRGMAILMSVVCGVLLAITAAGIVGLSSFWSASGASRSACAVPWAPDAAISSAIS